MPPIHPANAQFAEVFGRNNVVELQCSIHFKKHCKKFFFSLWFNNVRCFIWVWPCQIFFAKVWWVVWSFPPVMFEPGAGCAVLSVLGAISNVLAAKEVCENFVEELEHVIKWNIKSTSLFFSRTCLTLQLFASTCLVFQGTEISYLYNLFDCNSDVSAMKQPARNSQLSFPHLFWSAYPT